MSVTLEYRRAQIFLVEGALFLIVFGEKMINYGSVPFAAKLALYLFLVLPFLVLGGEQPSTVFYADNGLKQSIAYPLYG